MSKVTTISWTDHTFNPWWGCTKVSPGCDHCYAEAFDKRVGGKHWGKGSPRRVLSERCWRGPLQWNRDALNTLGRPARVFCASMADVMDDEAPEGQRERLWKLIDETPNLIWQLLTKRPHRFERYLPPTFKHGNVWLGVTAENQEFYDVRWPILQKECAKRDLTAWISYEPALGPLTLNTHAERPAWIIFGGESGHGRRECKREWADAIVAEIAKCKPRVQFFMKQMGARTPAKGKELIPAELLIQEFPA